MRRTCVVEAGLDFISFALNRRLLEKTAASFATWQSKKQPSTTKQTNITKVNTRNQTYTPTAHKNSNNLRRFDHFPTSVAPFRAPWPLPPPPVRCRSALFDYRPDTRNIRTNGKMHHFLEETDQIALSLVVRHSSRSCGYAAIHVPTHV